MAPLPRTPPQPWGERPDLLRFRVTTIVRGGLGRVGGVRDMRWCRFIDSVTGDEAKSLLNHSRTLQSIDESQRKHQAPLMLT